MAPCWNCGRFPDRAQRAGRCRALAVARPVVEWPDGHLPGRPDRVHRHRVRIRGYYFPWGTKTIPYSSIRSLERFPCPPSGQLADLGVRRLQALGQPRPRRPKKSAGFFVDVGRRIVPFLTPDDPDAFEQVVRQHLPADRRLSAAGRLRAGDRLDGDVQRAVLHPGEHVAGEQVALFEMRIARQDERVHTGLAEIPRARRAPGRDRPRWQHRRRSGPARSRSTDGGPRSPPRSASARSSAWRATPDDAASSDRPRMLPARGSDRAGQQPAGRVPRLGLGLPHDDMGTPPEAQGPTQSLGAVLHLRRSPRRPRSGCRAT